MFSRCEEDLTLGVEADRLSERLLEVLLRLTGPVLSKRGVISGRCPGTISPGDSNPACRGSVRTKGDS